MQKSSFSVCNDVQQLANDSPGVDLDFVIHFMNCDEIGSQ